MSELQDVIERAYQRAEAGHWDGLLSDWEKSDAFARRCSRYVRLGSAWTFLHQAAYFGCEQACRVLIGRGASLEALTHDSRTAAEVAEEKGHHELAALLRDASTGADSLWAPPVDPDVLPSSDRWNEATEARAESALSVAYGGGVVKIPKGARYFVDSLGRVLVGCHGTFDPPCGMSDQSMLS